MEKVRCYARRKRGKDALAGASQSSASATPAARLCEPEEQQEELELEQEQEKEQAEDERDFGGSGDGGEEELEEGRAEDAGEWGEEGGVEEVEVEAAERRMSAQEELEYEERILNSADAIWAKRQTLDASKRLPARGREPVRSKAHWDFVLEEMAWLAKDFEKERKWKHAQAKKVALKLSKSKVDYEAKGVRRLKEERQRERKVASGIAKDVKKFWMKVEKLMLYKYQLEVEERKKKALDRHLGFLLDQTERYSTMLAENLADPCFISAPKSPLLMSATTFASNAGAGTGNGDKQAHEEEDKLLTESTGTSSTTVGGNRLLLLEQKVEGFNHAGSSVNPSPNLAPKPRICLVDQDRGQADGRGAVSPFPLGQSRIVVDAGGQIDDHLGKAEELTGVSETSHRDPEATAHAGPLNDQQHDTGVRSVLVKKSLGCVRFSEGTQDSDVATALSRSDECAGRSHSVLGADVPEAADLHAQGHKSNVSILKVELFDNSFVAKEGGPNCQRQGTSPQSPPLEGRGVQNGSAIAGARQLVVSTNVVGSSQEESDDKSSREILVDAAAAARSAQPTGYTFSTTKVRTVLPFLLKHSLREYQHIGLDWLVTMYEKRLNGILADEMGLGKTIMTISLLALLACEKGIWGPHLIVVPTSVMINWETEFMKWCPAFKIMTYFGNARERKVKRQGWSKPNSFHVCITTYRLVIQDAKAFKRKKWKYLILDEAHLIKNWRSQRWQTLLNFNSKRRILLTGTPLQNDLMELWSLMHFLMPHVFQSHQQFRDWFSNPITGMVEGQEQVNKELVDRLHNVLRPFLLRRLKQDVEKQLPSKHEHVIFCRLSKRQRNLYEDFMASSETQATLSSGNFLGIINVLMQLRKVCNHPDLFEGRPIISSCDMPGINMNLSVAVCSALQIVPVLGLSLGHLNLLIGNLEFDLSAWETEEIKSLATPASLIEEISSSGQDSWHQHEENQLLYENGGLIGEIQAVLRAQRLQQLKEKARAWAALNSLRCSVSPVLGQKLRQILTVEHPVYDVHKVEANAQRYLEFSSRIADAVQLPLQRMEFLLELIEAFVFAIPAARALPPSGWFGRKLSSGLAWSAVEETKTFSEMSCLLEPLRPVFVRRQLFFPDRRLLQFDCGKLQELAVLLRRLKSEGHRALIFTQMTKMLDILESFINLYGYTYMRLDGATKPEQRQILMQRFNTNPKIFLFILSTRSGGVGINLVGADTVIFYDSDWNPAMDLQAQDRCHRIGQTREVHIYRLVSESTVEENILKKANQKRVLDDLVIQSGSYNTDFFKKLDPMELFSGLRGGKVGGGVESPVAVDDKSGVSKHEVSNADVDAALKNAEDEADYIAMKIAEQEKDAENQEFTEEGFAGIMDDDECLDEHGGGRAHGDGLPAQSVNGEMDETPVPEAVKENLLGAALAPTEPEEDMDMLEDVKQIAAAAAASGRGNISFEDQLLPIERYAMRILDLFDAVPRKVTPEADVVFEEKEWELDQLDKLKEEQEAEIDVDNEPLYYESWDTSLANEAYRQQVEVLFQQQENERLEWEAINDEMYNADRAVAEAAATVSGGELFKLKHKSKDKSKKAKFKSLRNDGFPEDRVHSSASHKELEGFVDVDDFRTDSSFVPSRSPSQRKRKAPKLLEEEILVELEQRKLWKESANKDRGGRIRPSKRPMTEKALSEFSDQQGWLGSMGPDSMVFPPASITATAVSSVKGKLGGMTVKKGPLVMLEKERKKDAVRSIDQIPQADPWMPAEDAVLCAVLHEYGGNWLLVSDALAGVPDGGVYKGRHRYTVHCKERFRQLLSQNASAANGDPGIAKVAAANTQLKVTEEHTKRLLELVQQLPDNEFLLQRHFLSVLESIKLLRGSSTQTQFVQGIRGISSPKCADFISVEALTRPIPAVSRKIEALIWNSGLTKAPGLSVRAILEQTDISPTVSVSVPNVITSNSPSNQSSPDSSPAVEGVCILHYLVGFADLAKGCESSVAVVSPRKKSLSIEELLGLKSLPSVVSPADGLRPLFSEMIEQRFRKSSKICFDGELSKWVAAAGSLTGVMGMEVPAKRITSKKRPSRDVNKPPKLPRVVEATERPGDHMSSQPESLDSGPTPRLSGGPVRKQQATVWPKAVTTDKGVAHQTIMDSDFNCDYEFGSRAPLSPSRKGNANVAQQQGGYQRLSVVNSVNGATGQQLGQRDDRNQVKLLHKATALHCGERSQAECLPQLRNAGSPKPPLLHTRASISRSLAGPRGITVVPGSSDNRGSRSLAQTSAQGCAWPNSVTGMSHGDVQAEDGGCTHLQGQRKHFECQSSSSAALVLRHSVTDTRSKSNPHFFQHQVAAEHTMTTNSQWACGREHLVMTSSWLEDQPMNQALHSPLALLSQSFQPSDEVNPEHSRGFLAEHYQLMLEAAGGFPSGLDGAASGAPRLSSSSPSHHAFGVIPVMSSFSEPSSGNPPQHVRDHSLHSPPPFHSPRYRADSDALATVVCNTDIGSSHQQDLTGTSDSPSL